MLLRVIIADPDYVRCKELSDQICNVSENIMGIDIATNAEELVRKAIDIRATAVFLNFSLPGLKEFDAIKKIKRRKKVCTFVAVLEDASKEQLVEIFMTKIDDILLRPYTLEQLKECVDRAVASAEEKQDSSAQRDHYVMAKEFLLDRALFNFRKSTRIEDVNERFHTRFMTGFFRAMLIRADFRNGKQTPFYDDFPVRQREMLFARKYLNDFCSEFCVRYCINGIMILINYPAGSDEEVTARIGQMFEELSDYAKTVDRDLDVSICVGRAYPNIWQIQDSVEDTYRADWARMGRGSGKLVFWDESMVLQENLEEKIEELSRKASRACTVLEVEEFDKCVDDLFNLPNSTLGHRRIRKWTEWFIDTFFETNAELLEGINNEMVSKNAITEQLAYTKSFGEFRQHFQTYFDNLFHELMLQSERRSVKPIRVAMQYVQENYDKQIRVEDIAKKVNMSASYFSTMFKKQTGTNFTNYVTEYRMQVAKKLLQETDMTICEVSDALGFSDQRYFSKTFKKSVGQSPGDFRKAKG